MFKIAKLQLRLSEHLAAQDAQIGHANTALHCRSLLRIRNICAGENKKLFAVLVFQQLKREKLDPESC